MDGHGRRTLIEGGDVGEPHFPMDDTNDRERLLVLARAHVQLGISDEEQPQKVTAVGLLEGERSVDRFHGLRVTVFL